jgi:hypothetical protein
MIFGIGALIILVLFISCLIWDHGERKGYERGYQDGLIDAGVGTQKVVDYVNRSRKKPHKPCPHGHEDWDECPVCCH